MPKKDTVGKKGLSGAGKREICSTKAERKPSRGEDLQAKWISSFKVGRNE